MAKRGHDWKRKDARQDKGAVHELALAGTAQSTHVYGCVVFDLTFINEVTNNPSSPTTQKLSIAASILLSAGR